MERGSRRGRGGRARERQVAFDQRTGFKVFARKLREDGYLRGLWTTDPDPPHPQDYLLPPGPDNVGSRARVFPPIAEMDVAIVPGTGVASDLVTPLVLPVLSLSTGGAR